MGLFTNEPADRPDDEGKATRGKASEGDRARMVRRMGKNASDHRARVEDPDKWPNHDKRGRGSR